METRRQVLGENHPDILTSMPKLAFTLNVYARNGEVIDLMAHCVQLQRRILGAEHPDTFGSSAALAEWLSVQNVSKVSAEYLYFVKRTNYTVLTSDVVRICWSYTALAIVGSKLWKFKQY